MREGITFQIGPHSADRDHTLMTGGTLSELKILRSTEGISLAHYLLPGIDTHISRLDAGLHTLEHMLAYSTDTGSLRTQIEQLTGNKEIAQCIIDVSPYRVSEGIFGFRVTSVIPLDKDVLTTAYAHSLTTGTKYILKGGKPPFATPKQCGQYDLHSNEAALKIIHSAQEKLNTGLTALDISSPRPAASIITVGDLRLIRPKATDAHTQRTLRPDVSHIISQLMEQFAYLSLPNPENGRRLAFGVYGCMTGDYAMTLDIPLDVAHVAIARVLSQLTPLKNSSNPNVRFIGEDAAFCLDHIHEYSPDTYEHAMDLGSLPFDVNKELEHVGTIRRKPTTL